MILQSAAEMLGLRRDGKTYRTSPEQRLIAKNRRDGLRAKKLCLNGAAHGAAVRSSRCEPCALTLEASR